MPQIAQIGEIYASQLFWLAIFFGAIFVVIGLGMLPKIQSTVDKRDSQIANDLAEAEKARERADALEEDHRKAMDKARGQSALAVAEAKAVAARQTEQRLAEADASVEAKLGEAQARIAQAREAALSELQDVAADATLQMAERVARLKVDPKTAREAVERELAHG